MRAMRGVYTNARWKHFFENLLSPFVLDATAVYNYKDSEKRVNGLQEPG